MIIVISNRIINESSNKEDFFGETLNPQGADKLRIAKAYYQGENSPWVIEALPKENNFNSDDSLIRNFFLDITNGIKEQKYRERWVFYNPGFNQSSRSALDASQKLSEKYDVDVILFSWPSNPNGRSNSIRDLLEVYSEYQEALSVAEASAKALEKAFGILNNCFLNSPFNNLSRTDIKCTFLSHSLGNYVFENCIKLSSDNVEEIFDSIILHQADVHNKNHEEWVDNITNSSNIYITINRHDDILELSGTFHKLQGLNSQNSNNRLGNNTKNLTANKPRYIDFTKGDNVSRYHNLFFNVDNQIIWSFFDQIFKGNSKLSPVFTQSANQSNVYSLIQ